MTIKLQMGVRSLRLVDLSAGGPRSFFGEECCHGFEKGSLLERYLCTVTSFGYSELLSIPRETYTQVAIEHEEIMQHVNPVLGELVQSASILFWATKLMIWCYFSEGGEASAGQASVEDSRCEGDHRESMDDGHGCTTKERQRVSRMRNVLFAVSNYTCARVV
jgi:hypothetical protein